MDVELKKNRMTGKGGSLKLHQNDEVARKLAMLIEGECEGVGPQKAAKKYGYTRQRYTQLRTSYLENGTAGLISKSRGPKKNYRRTDELTRQVILHRFLDPQASTEVIAQKLRQTGFSISNRSVERVIEEYGLQKKTLSAARAGRNRRKN